MALYATAIGIAEPVSRIREVCTAGIVFPIRVKVIRPMMLFREIMIVELDSHPDDGFPSDWFIYKNKHNNGNI